MLKTKLISSLEKCFIDSNFDDFAEMVDFAALRGEVCQLVGKAEEQGGIMQKAECRMQHSGPVEKVVKTRIFKGEYEYDGKKLIKKEKTA